METVRGRTLSIILVLLLGSSAIDAGNDSDRRLGWIPERQACRGTIEECIVGDEFNLASESSRRILAMSSYISYDALKHDSVPCSRRGASYYNCRPGAEANPYSRGCSEITQCRS